MFNLSRTRGWLLSLIGLQREIPSRTHRKRHSRSTRPWLEVLEDRVVPTTWTVANTNASGAGSLSQAVADADSDTTAAMITFDPTVFTSATTITVSSVLTLSNTSVPITIDGSGAGPITISGGGATEIFDISKNSTTATIENLTLTGGSASSGGAITNIGTLRVMDCTITGNTATNDGAGIYNHGGKAVATVQDSTISDNTAGGTGAGLYNDNLLTVSGGAITGNSAAGNGGGSETTGGTTTVSNCMVSGNTGDMGGGFYDENSSTLTVQSSTITGNSATDGGGIGNSNATSCTLFVFNCTISHNTSGQGGGIWNEGNQVTSCFIQNSTITANTSTGDGGGIWTQTWTVIENCIITSNSAAGNGGGIGGASGNPPTMTVINSLLANNHAVNGGGIYTPGTVSVVDSTITANTASTSGGGIDNTNTLNLVNSTIAGNSATVSGGGLANASTKVTILNTILTGNTSPTGADVSNSSAVSTNYSLIGTTAGSNISGGTGNVLNPSNSGLGTLGNNGGPTETIPLLAGSPAIQGSGSVTSLQAAMTSTDTSLTITNRLVFADTEMDQLASGSYFTIQIDNEQMEVTALTTGSGTTATLTVTRHANGTTAATHAANAPIFIVSDQRGSLAPFSTPPLVDMGAVTGTAVAYSQLGFTTQPPASVQANQSFSLVVSAENLIGTPVGGYSGPVTLSLANNPSGATLGGTLTVNAVNGVADFSNLSLNKIGTGFTIQAAATGLTSATSSAIKVTASKLVVTTVPASVSAGATFTMVVKAEDGSGDVDPTFTGNVTISLVSNPGGSTLGGTLTAAAVNGVATFANLTLNKIGTGYTIQAASAGLNSALSGGIQVTASTLVITVQPPGTIGINDTFTVVVAAEDASGDVDSSYTGNVTVSLASNPGASTLSGTLTVAAVNGLATFSNLSINNADNGYSIQATSGTLTPVTSNLFNVFSAHFAFSFAPPASVVAGATFPANVTAQLEDQNNNPLPTPNVVVTLTLPGGNLVGVTSATTDNTGLATFSSLSITTAGTFLFTASSAGVGSASSVIVVTPGPVSSIAFSAQPTGTTAGSALNPVIVQAVDQFGNGVPGVSVTLAISANSFNGAPTVVTNSAGQAVFSPLSVDLAGTYTFTASAATVSSASSNSFVITAGTASEILFESQPNNTTAGVALNAITVQAEDTFGNAVSGAAISIALAPGSLSSGTTLLTSNVAGQVVFSNLVEDLAGSYSLIASSTGLTSITSNSFTVSAAAAKTLTFLSQPSSTVAGAILNPVTVQVTDKFGNAVAGTPVGIALTFGTLSAGTTPIIANAGGLAIFSDLVENVVGTYTLSASSTGLTSILSSPFTISPAGVATLLFISEPMNTVAGNVINAVSVKALDPFNNFVSGVAVTIAVAPGSLTSGTLTQTSGATGLAVFNDLIEDVAGTYSLTASATGAANVTSSTFIVTAAAASVLSFMSQPTSTIAGATLNPITVQVADKFGNAVTGISIGIALSSGTLSTGTTPLISNPAGQVVFGDLSEDKVGTYSLKASASGLASVFSSPFTITPALATVRLAYLSQPSSTTAGTLIRAITVQIADQYGNAISGTAINIGIAPGTLSAGTTPLTSGATGQVVFSDLVEDTAGTYSLTASSSLTVNLSSSTFTITAAAAANLSFLSQPSSTTAGTVLNPITVGVADKFGNAVSGVTVSIGITPGKLSTGQTPQVSNASGQVTFSSLSEDTTGTYTLTASAAGLAGIVSSPFTITPSLAGAVLAFLTQPSSMQAGNTLNAVSVRVADKFGNLIAGVPVGIATTTGSLSSGTTPITSNALGLAVFSDLTEDQTGTYTLAASATGLTTIHSGAFVISGAAASSLFFVDQPNSAGVGAFLNSITVEAEDRFGNGVVSVPVSLSMPGGTLTGVSTVSTNTSGQAVYNNLASSAAGTFTLTASAPGLTSASSNAFTVTAGTATRLTFVNEPSSTTAGSVIGPVTLLALDKYGNGVANLAVGIGQTAAKLSTGTTPITTNSAGQAVFSDLTQDTVGTYTLSASVIGLANVLSSPFTISAGVPASVTFLSQPSSGPTGSSLGALSVAITDAYGNKITSGLATMAISAGSLTGNTTATINAAGQAVFSGLTVLTGGSYTLTASAGPASAVSNAFTMTTTADSLQFVAPPSAATAGATLNPVIVSLTDASGDPLPGVTLSVHLASGQLAGTTTAITNSLGQATFSNLTVGVSGTFTLVATAAGVPSVTSNSFTVSPATIGKVVFVTQPGTTTAGNTISTVTVRVTDAQGNLAVGAPVSISIANGSLTGITTATTNASGLAVFTGLSTTTAGSQTLTALSGATTGQSNTFTVLGATPVAVSFVTQPNSTVAGSILNPITALVVDKYGNGVANVSVGLYIYTLSTVDGNTTIVTNAQGDAIFTGLHVNKAGTDNLTLSVSGLPHVTSNNFTVTPQLSSAKLSFITQPLSTTANATLGPVTVLIVDQYGNVVPNYSVSIRLSSGTLGGTVTGITNSLGQITFNKLSIAAKGTGYTLIVSAPGLTSITSNAFSIT